VTNNTMKSFHSCFPYALPQAIPSTYDKNSNGEEKFMHYGDWLHEAILYTFTKTKEPHGMIILIKF